MIFAVQCPGNNQNSIQALVVADDETGTNARALVFPTTYPADREHLIDALSNIRWLDGGEIGELFVDPEEIEGPADTRRAGAWSGRSRSRS